MWGLPCSKYVFEVGGTWEVMGDRNHWLGMWRVPAWGELERHGMFQRGLDEDSSHFLSFLLPQIEPFK